MCSNIDDRYLKPEEKPKEKNLTERLQTLGDQFNSSINSLQDTVLNTFSKVNIDIEYARDEVVIRVESLKIELDNLKEVLLDEINGYERELNEQLNSYDVNSYRRILDQMDSNIKNDTEKSFSEYQSKLKEVKKMIKSLEAMNHSVSIEIGKSMIQADTIALINCNYNSIHGKLKQGKHETKVFESLNNKKIIAKAFKDTCSLRDGRFVVSSYADKNLNIYDKDFKCIERVCIQNILGKQDSIYEVMLATNQEDRIFMLSDGDLITVTDFNLKYITSKNLQLYAPDINIKPDNEEVFQMFEMRHQSNITYHKKHLYICNSGLRCIAVLDENLNAKSKIFFDFKPQQMVIHNDVACILPIGNGFHFFYDTLTWKIKFEYPKMIFKKKSKDMILCTKEECDKIINFEELDSDDEDPFDYPDQHAAIAFQNKFYVLDRVQSKIDVYNKNGLYLDSINLSGNSDGFLTYHQNKFLVSQDELFMIFE